MSKKKFDACIVNVEGKKLASKKFTNQAKGFTSFLSWVGGFYIDGEILFCMEYTGVYSRLLMMYIQDEGFSLCMESGYVIKSRGGLLKGKNDKLDAYRIADYALSNKHRLRIADPYKIEIIELQDLMATRKRLVKMLKQMETPLKEAKMYAGKQAYDLINKASESAIIGIKQSIKEVDNLIDLQVETNADLTTNYNLASSVKGIGRIATLWMIIYTDNFKQGMTARKFASLAGIAPFLSESGSSVRRGSHVSMKAHRFLKGILHTSVMCSIRTSPQMKAYHSKKKKEGKKGLLVMNNIKNKLVQTTFAVVRSGKPYQENFKHALTG